MKKRIFTCLLFWLLLLTKVLPAQVQDPAYNLLLQTLLSHSVREVTVNDAALKASTAIFLDAREKREYDVSHLKDAIYVGFNEFTIASIKDIAKDNPVIVYCSVGYRSEKISEKLISADFTNVSNLYGGIFEWVNEGHVVYDLYNQPTDKVHGYNSLWGMWLTEGEKVY